MMEKKITCSNCSNCIREWSCWELENQMVNYDHAEKCERFKSIEEQTEEDAWLRDEIKEV